MSLQKEEQMSKITPFLWFDQQAEEAANLYASIFQNTKIGQIARYGEGAPLPKGTAMTVEFELDGQRFTALNGGPYYKFNEAVSFVVDCTTQEEVDHYWAKLTADGGEEGQCGWLKDKFGVSWQVIPRTLKELLGSRDPKKAQAAMHAMLQMKKIEIAALRRAHD
jgi:predicted 3-demethylubiquinone-9 3-methyltransferase (glyoxalase superfamily)